MTGIQRITKERSKNHYEDDETFGRQTDETMNLFTEFLNNFNLFNDDTCLDNHVCSNTNQFSKKASSYDNHVRELLSIVDVCTDFLTPKKDTTEDRSENSSRTKNERGEYKRRTTKLTFIVANARSLAPKIQSWIDSFDELDLHFSLMTESWLRDGFRLDQDVEDLELGKNIALIHKNRMSKKKKSVGGGDLIAYNRAKITFKERKIRKSMSEVICAVGRLDGVRRKIIAITVYLPPKINAAKLSDALACISEAIGQAKEDFEDPIFIVGGDFNKFNLSPAFEDYPDIF